MGDAAQLRLRIPKCRNRALRITGQSADIIVWRIRGRFTTSQYHLRFVVERRNYRLVDTRIAAEEAFGSERLEVQTIDERPITFRRSSGSGQIDVVSVLNDRAGAAAESAAATTKTTS